MTLSPEVKQYANKLSGWLVVCAFLTFVAALAFKSVDPVRSVIEVDAGGEPLGIPTSIPCPCGQKMRFTRDDFDRPIYQCPSCKLTREIPVQR